MSPVLPFQIHKSGDATREDILFCVMNGSDVLLDLGFL